MTLKQEVQKISASPKELRDFGLLVGGILILIALFQRHQADLKSVFFIVGALLVIFGIVAPIVLKPVYKIWMTLAVILGYVMTRIILLIMFFGVITPVAFLMRSLGKNTLETTINKRSKSYWKKKQTPDNVESYFNQY